MFLEQLQILCNFPGAKKLLVLPDNARRMVTRSVFEALVAMAFLGNLDYKG